MATQTRERETAPSRVDVLVQQSMDWEHPSRAEVAVTGAFITRQGGQIHHGLDGSSQLDVERRRYDRFRPYLQLEEALKVYLPHVLGIRLLESHSAPMWEDLSEKIGSMEKQFKGAKRGLWHSLWHKMGQSQETADAWIAFIPDEYGLSVVKAGLAMVFKLAESSADKRQMIFDTFSTLQDTLILAHPERRSFRTNQKLNGCVDRLYQTVVDSIQDMAVWLVTEEKSTWDKVTSKFKRRHDKAPVSPEEILQKLQDHTKDFHEALEIARDQAIQDTELMSRATGLRTVMIHRQLVATHEDVQITRHNTDELRARINTYTNTVERYGTQVSDRVERFGGKIADRVSHLSVDMGNMNKKMDQHAEARQREHDEHGQHYQSLRDLIINEIGDLKKLSERESRRAAAERNKRIARRETAIQESQEISRTLLLNLLLDRKQMEARIAHLETQLQHPPAQTKPLLTLNRFLQILARPLSSPTPHLPLRTLLQHPTRDLSLALAEQHEPTSTLQSQGQVQSLLTRPAFTTWLNTPLAHSLLLVDAHLDNDSAALQALSVTSAVCATLVTSIMDVFPPDDGDTVVVSFFCGLHCLPSDAWYGPAGMVRSLVMQLVMRLVDMDKDRGEMAPCWGLGFVDSAEYVRALEGHGLQALCQTLHLVLGEFSAGTTVYCVVDGVGRFDVDRLWGDWEFVVGCLGAVVEDGGLGAVVKVLLVNPGRSTLRVRGLDVFEAGTGVVVDLSEMDREPMEISARVVGGRLRRVRTPEVTTAWERGQGSGGDLDGDYYEEEDGYYRYDHLSDR